MDGTASSRISSEVEKSVFSTVHIPPHKPSTVQRHNYYVYIITNRSRRSLYIGVTNNLRKRLRQHHELAGTNLTWAGRYQCRFLVYYEEFKYIDQAIAREKQLKRWSRKKKDWLISTKNPDWRFLNDEYE